MVVLMVASTDLLLVAMWVVLLAVWKAAWTVELKGIHSAAPMVE